MAHGDIYDGNNPKNIAGQGLIGPVESVTIASQGFITPSITDIDLVTGGAADYTTLINGIFTYYVTACPQGLALGGSADIQLIVFGGVVTGGAGDYNVTYNFVSAGGGVVTGGEARVPRFIHEATGGLVTGGEALVESNVEVPSKGSGAIISFIPARRKIQPQPHIWIYKGWPKRKSLVIGGAADIEFIKVIPRKYTKPLELYLNNQELRALDTPKEQEKTNIIKQYMSKIALEKSAAKQYTYIPGSEISITAGGSATVEFFDHQNYMVIRDDALLLDLEMLQRDKREHYLSMSYTTENKQNTKDEEELLLWL